MLRTITIKIDEDCTLDVKGYYSKAEPDVNLSSNFEIDTVESYEKDLTSLLLWTENKNALVELEELCIKEIEEEQEYGKDT